MNTIYEYLEKYKNVSFDEIGITDADFLLFSILVYSVDFAYFSSKCFKDYCLDILSFDSTLKNSYMFFHLQKIAKMLLDSKRYENILVNDYVHFCNEKCQFGATIFKINDLYVIAFEGSDGTLISWLENFRLGYKFPTSTQDMAYHYALSHMKEKKEYVLLGHSKGGNMALAASYLLPNNYQDLIKAIYNFDGPGFLFEQVNTSSFKNISNKIINVVPNKSFIGSILENNEKYIVINSEAKGPLVHSPTSWEIVDGSFKNVSSLSNISYRLHKASTDGLKNIKREDLESLVEKSFAALLKNSSPEKEISFGEIKKAIEDNKESHAITFSLIKKTVLVFALEMVKAKFVS